MKKINYLTNKFKKIINFTIICITIIYITSFNITKADYITDYFIAKNLLTQKQYELSMQLFYKIIINNIASQKIIKKSKLYTTIINHKTKKNKLAITNINNFIKTYKTNKYINYAYYIRSILNDIKQKNIILSTLKAKKYLRDQSLNEKSIKDLKLIKNNSKNLKLKKITKKKIETLKNQIISHKIAISKYYIKRKLYKPSINRINEIKINKHLNKKTTYKALYIKIKSYNELFLNKKSKKIIQINTIK